MCVPYLCMHTIQYHRSDCANAAAENGLSYTLTSDNNFIYLHCMGETADICLAKLYNY